MQRKKWIPAVLAVALGGCRDVPTQSETVAPTQQAAVPATQEAVKATQEAVVPGCYCVYKVAARRGINLNNFSLDETVCRPSIYRKQDFVCLPCDLGPVQTEQIVVNGCENEQNCIVGAPQGICILILDRVRRARDPEQGCPNDARVFDNTQGICGTF